MDQQQQDEAARHAERFDSIPWASLVPEEHSRARRAVAVGAMVAAGVVLGLVGGRIMRAATEQGVVVTLPPPASSAAMPAPPTAPPPSITAAAAVTTGAPEAPPVSPRLYAEADLMAVLPEEEMRIAVVRAEWFVTDYFSIDGASADDVSRALPDALDVAPPGVADGDGTSSVVWARAFRVDPRGPGRYEVAVAFRTVAGVAGGEAVRMPVRAVTVVVEVDVDGDTAVVDLPTPADPPGTLHRVGVAVPDAEAPPEVVAAAVQEALLVGTDPVPVAAGLVGDTWRIVVVVGDASGRRWPLAVHPTLSN